MLFYYMYTHMASWTLLCLDWLVYRIIYLRITGYFWQVTDFHYDANYSSTGDPSHMCHHGNNSSSNIGNYGNYHCDAPWQLITSAVRAMHKLQPNPDFIVWTG